MNASPYDLVVLREQATLWRAEAATTTCDARRKFCIAEADRYDRLVEMSVSTPMFREMADTAQSAGIA
jgi:hypothetical protein